MLMGRGRAILTGIFSKTADLRLSFPEILQKYGCCSRYIYEITRSLPQARGKSLLKMAYVIFVILKSHDFVCDFFCDFSAL